MKSIRKILSACSRLSSPTFLHSGISSACLFMVMPMMLSSSGKRKVKDKKATREILGNICKDEWNSCPDTKPRTTTCSYNHNNKITRYLIILHLHYSYYRCRYLFIFTPRYELL